MVFCLKTCERKVCDKEKTAVSIPRTRIIIFPGNWLVVAGAQHRPDLTQPHGHGSYTNARGIRRSIPPPYTVESRFNDTADSIVNSRIIVKSSTAMY